MTVACHLGEQSDDFSYGHIVLLVKQKVCAGSLSSGVAVALLGRLTELGIKFGD